MFIGHYFSVSGGPADYVEIITTSCEHDPTLFAQIARERTHAHGYYYYY